MDGTLVLQNRRNLVLDGNGARIFAGTTGGSGRRQWTVREGVNITFRDMIVQGVGNAIYTPSYEHQHAFGLDGVRTSSWTASRSVTHGAMECYVRAGTTPGSTVSGSTTVPFPAVGRQGIAVVAGRNVRVERTSFSNMGSTVLDIEPDKDPNYMQGADNVVFVNNTVTGCLASYYLCGWRVRKTISNVVVSGNVVQGSRWGIWTHSIPQSGSPRRSNFTFTDNRGDVAFSGSGSGGAQLPGHRWAHGQGQPAARDLRPRHGRRESH